jgi:hypothetical protein
MLGNDVIGFGRIIGYGGVYLYIQGVILLPEFQDRKLENVL